jgi:hypothetical protein
MSSDSYRTTLHPKFLMMYLSTWVVALIQEVPVLEMNEVLQMAMKELPLASSHKQR